MEVNVKEARANISGLLDKTLNGEVIMIVRRGKKVARLVPLENDSQRLPDLSDFRSSIVRHGQSLSQAVIESRNEERY